MYDGTRIYRIMTSAGSRMEGFQPFFLYDPDLICCYDLFVAWFCSYDFDMVSAVAQNCDFDVGQKCDLCACVFFVGGCFDFFKHVLNTYQNHINII